MPDFLMLAAILVLMAVAVGLLRLLYGAAEDRMMSAQLLGTGGIAVVLLLGAAEGVPAAVNLALTLALLAAFAAAAFVRAVTGIAKPTPEDNAEL